MKIDAKIEGLNKQFRRLDKFSEDTEKRINKELWLSGFKIETDVKRKLHAQPFINSRGGLASSYHAARIGKEVFVGSDKQYARWIEFGERTDPRYGKVYRRFKHGVNAFFSSVNSEIEKLMKRLGS